MYDLLQFLQIDVGPGDLLYFPTHWPHAVENVGDEFGFGYGFRPFGVQKKIKDVLFPLFASRGMSLPTLAFGLRIFSALYGDGSKRMTSVGKGSTNNVAPSYMRSFLADHGETLRDIFERDPNYLKNVLAGGSGVSTGQGGEL